MITDELKFRIRSALVHTPTAEQENAIDVFSMFMTDRHEQTVMILRGSAGTGKTTLAASIVKALLSLQQKMVLMAPTGRAAKVFSLYAGQPAYTIHRRIYRQKSLESSFDLNYNSAQDTLYIIDEASMIANASNYGDTPFANGQLLDDLVQFVYNGRNCRMLLIGDQAQLPPVGEEESPALMTDVLRGYGLHVYECNLQEVLRQSQESGILWNATETMVITRSNKRANIYNQGIRNMVLGREEGLTRGDQLMVVKNNYSLTPNPSPIGEGNYKGEGSVVPAMEFIANGDRCVVRKVRNVHEQYGFHFAEVTMTFPDYDDYELTSLVMLDTLTSEAPALTREQQEQLYQAVMEDYK